MFPSLKVYPSPFHPDHFILFKSFDELEVYLKNKAPNEKFILQREDLPIVDFSYFASFASGPICLSLAWQKNFGQKFLNLNQQKISSQMQGNHIHDGFVLGQFKYFENSSFVILKNALITQEFIGLSAIPVPQKTGKTKALFLDRDGVINIDKAYVYKKEDLNFLPGLFSFLRHARSLSYELHVMTNQSGVARAYYKEEDVIKLHLFMHQELEKEGIEIKSWNYSLFHEDATIPQYKLLSQMRKPRPGMLLSLSEQYAFHFESSLMIGDKNSDVLDFLGLKSVLLQGKYPLNVSDHKVVASLEELSLLI